MFATASAQHLQGIFQQAIGGGQFWEAHFRQAWIETVYPPKKKNASRSTENWMKHMCGVWGGGLNLVRLAPTWCCHSGAYVSIQHREYFTPMPTGSWCMQCVVEGPRVWSLVVEAGFLRGELAAAAEGEWPNHAMGVCTIMLGAVYNQLEPLSVHV